MKVENNLDTDKVRGLVWRLAFPSMLAQFVNVLYSICLLYTSDAADD